MSQSTRLGVVVIGRNEGERLRACLRSLNDVPARVYVDSGSTDGSRELARRMGFEVVELAIPPGFTAARARNAGVDRLRGIGDGPAYVQFVDGDCEVRAGWLDDARRELEAKPDAAVVFGRRRERHPDANIYHMACDDEWNVPTGEVGSCGGDALFRLSALLEAGGYDPSLIAGEEPDLCLRLRGKGWKVRSTGREMTLHDIAMTRFSQWWRRCKRTGYGIADLVRKHGKNADPGWNRLLRSAVLWSAVAAFGVVALVVAIVDRRLPAILLACLSPALLLAQTLRLALKQRARSPSFGQALAWAWLIMTAKAAQAAGYVEYHVRRRANRGAGIIEYKS